MTCNGCVICFPQFEISLSVQRRAEGASWEGQRITVYHWSHCRASLYQDISARKQNIGPQLEKNAVVSFKIKYDHTNPAFSPPLVA